MSDLGIVYCHFNPIQYKNRIRNLRNFQESLRDQLPENAHVVSVEATFPGQAPISNPTIHIKAEEQHLMWQKERLLNIGLHELKKRGCSKVAWLDADILFTRKDWFYQTSLLLDQVSVAQLFSQVKMEGHPEPNLMKGSIFSQLETKLKKSKSGFAWAARMEALPNNLLDTQILGGADHMMSSTWLGVGALIRKHWTEASGDRYFNIWQEWEAPTLLKNRGVWYLDGTLRHQYHGSALNRKYIERHSITKRYDFSKERDLVMDDTPGSMGLWRWTDETPEGMKREIREYFSSRQEDA